MNSDPVPQAVELLVAVVLTGSAIRLRSRPVSSLVWVRAPRHHRRVSSSTHTRLPQGRVPPRMS